MLDIKRNGSTVHQKSFYWEDKDTGYIISVVKGPECFLKDKDLEEVLEEQVQEYLNAKRLSRRHL